MTVLAPDELVQKICEEIAYQKGRISLFNLWQLVEGYIDISDEQIKKFVFACLISHPDVFVLSRGRNDKNFHYEEVASIPTEVHICITDDMLWITLTGYQKKECSIGGLAFELLLHIARTKNQGINTMELARETSQDPRSITGRIKKLGNLVTGTQIIYKGHVVKHLKFHKFATDQVVSNSYVGMRDHLPKIVDVVKNSKNGVRQLIDLKRELKFDKDKRLSKSFIAAIAWLDEKEYLKKVLVVSPSSPSIKIRCVKFLRDYVPEEKSTNEFEDESDAEDDQELGPGDDKLNGEEEEAFEGLDNFNATHLLQDQNLILQDSAKSERKEFLLNRFYPMQNQTYGLASKYGVAGISTMEAVNVITGKDYKRSFTKCSEYYLDSVGKPSKNLSGFGLVRVYDFEGKKKFYRLFTDKNFRTLSGAETPRDEGLFRLLKIQRKNLKEISHSNFVPLSNTLRFLTQNGNDQFFWNGDLKVPSNGNAAPRGRKRKQLSEVEDGGPSKRSLNDALGPQHDREPSIPDQIQKLEDVPDQEPHNDANVDIGKTLFRIDGFSANSLKSLQRQRAILDTIKKSGGVTLFRDQLFADVTKLMGSRTLLDKKTIKGDVERLVTSGKVCLELDPASGRRLLTLPEVPAAAVLKFLTEEKDSKKSYFNDVIQNTDIYFFDQTESNRFHRGTKSAERVKKFEKAAVKGRKPVEHRRSKKAKKSAVPSGDEQQPAPNSLTNSSSKHQKRKINESSAPMKNGKENTETFQSFNIGNKDGVRALTMAVVITKSIKGQIVWDSITKVFPNNSVGNLKKQWTIRRIRMGHGGWKAQLEKWRKTIVEAMKEERASLEDVEQLNLIKLIKIWYDFEMDNVQKPIKLFKNYEENYKRYTFVRDNSMPTKIHGLDMSSMVQRESWLLRKLYTFKPGSKGTDDKISTEEQIRTVARSLLIESPKTEIDEIEPLKKFSKDEVDKVILDMAKERQITFVSTSKLQLTDTVLEFLGNRGNFHLFDGAVDYGSKLFMMLSNRKGCVVSDEVSDFAAIVLLHLFEAMMIDVHEIRVSTKEIPMHYTTRKYEVGALTPPMLYAAGKQLEEDLPVRATIPVGKPCSKIWIDLQGNIRPNVWKKVVALVLKEILFNPGITSRVLASRCRKVVSFPEVNDIVNWCLKRNVINTIAFDGLIARDNWYKVFA